MSTVRRKRMGALVLAAAAAFGLAFAGASPASADPGAPAAPTASTVNITLDTDPREILVEVKLEGLGRNPDPHQILTYVACDSVPYTAGAVYNEVDQYGNEYLKVWFRMNSSLVGKQCVVGATSVSSNQRVYFDRPNGTRVTGHVVTYSRNGGL